MKKVISACLLGVNCRYDGKSKLSESARREFEDGEAILLCPELLANLGVPRPACEIVGGDGFDVLAGNAKIIDSDGNDVTKEYISGAEKAAEIVTKSGIKEAVLKSGSPSCGCGTVYDGTFSGKKKTGYGVFAAILQEKGIKVREI
jgi:uncharacterized protein YbbK (DUF523 family)